MKKHQVSKTVKEVVVKPGDRLPQGIFVKGWKLDTSQFGPGAIVIHYEEK